MPNPVESRFIPVYMRPLEDDNGFDPPVCSKPPEDEVVSSEEPLMSRAPSPSVQQQSASNDAKNAAPKSPCDVLPDYYSLSGGVAMFSGSATVTRYGQVYTGGGGALGGSTTPGFALTEGYLRDPHDVCKAPSAEKLDSATISAQVGAEHPSWRLAP